MIYASVIVIVASALFCFSAVCAQETQCFPNATISPCGGRCEERCNAPPGLPSFCNGLQCEDSGCRCDDGFARDPDSNHCVPKADCPVNECAVGEFKGACGKTCEGTCDSPRTPEICSRIRCAIWSCRCDLAGGFVRNSEKKCIRREECPKKESNDEITTTMKTN